MAATWKVDSIRRLILSTLGSMNRGGTGILAETGWIRFGYQHCWRFDCREVQAVWFLEEHAVKFYRRDRTLLRIVRLESVPQDLQAA